MTTGSIRSNQTNGGVSVRQRWPQIILGLMMALYLAYFGWYTLRAYDAFVYQAYDLGIYDQAVWNTAHGRPFRSTLEEPYENLLGDHFEPILLLIALVYLVWDSPQVLLLLQTMALALGALPVYWLARDALGPAWAGRRRRPGAAEPSDPSPPAPVHIVALVLAGVYLLYPPVHATNVFEFHPSALAIPFLLFAIYFVRRQRIALYFVLVILTMSTKEIMPLVTLALGLYVLLFEKKRAVGLWTMAASALWFGLVVFVAIPYFSPENESQYFGEFYGWLGGSTGEILARLITHPALVWQRLIRPDSLLYLRALLRPTAYVSLFGLPMLLGALPGLLLNVLSDWPPQHDPLNFYQYAAPIAPFVIAAAIDGTAFLTRHLGRALERAKAVNLRGMGAAFPIAILLAGSMLVASLVIQREHGYLPFSEDYSPPVRDEKANAAHAMVQQVPPGSSVSADLVFGPYLSHRENLHIYPVLRDADYLVIDASYRDTPFNPRDRHDAIQDLLASSQYGVVDARYGYLLLERNQAQPVIPERFYDFAKTARPSPQIPADITFGNDLRLTGLDLVQERSIRPRAHLTLYWQAKRPVDRDLRLFFVLTSPSGELLPGTELEFDATVWYPPMRWSQGQAIRTETAYWSLETPRRFGVAIGVVEGPGFWEVDKRLQPQIGVAGWPTRQVHDGSLVWLATIDVDGQLATLLPPGSEPNR